MYKNQLQELAQRSCFNLPSYSCIREGPDHAPRFKSTVTFNGESFESPGFCNTLRQAEHAAAEVALNTLSKRGPTQSLAARILDETGVCKNLLQETAQRAGVNLPVYSVVRSGPGHMPLFVSTVQLAGMSFVGESAKTKKQAEKNAAMAAWASLKQLVTQGGTSSHSPSDSYASEDQLQIVIARALMNAAQEGSTMPRTQGPPRFVPSVSNPRIKIIPLEEAPVPNPRIKITPLEECAVQETMNAGAFMNAAAEGSTLPRSQGPPRVIMSVPNTRVKISPLEESSGEETINAQASSSWTTADAKADPTTGQEQAMGSFNGSPCVFYNECSHNSVSETASRMVTSGSVNIVGQRAGQVHTVTIIPGTDSQMTFVPINEFQQDDRRWFQSGTPTIIITNSNDVSSSDSRVPLVHQTYTPVVWTGDHHQYMSTRSASGRVQPLNSTFKPVTSLAPRVRVRQTVPVCSAPPRPSKSEEQGMNTTEAAVRQDLGDLKL